MVLFLRRLCSARSQEDGFWNPFVVNMAMDVKPVCFGWWSKMEKKNPPQEMDEPLEGSS